MSKQLRTIAFDLGGVIFSSHNDNVIFTDRYLEASLTEGIYHVVTDLARDKTNKLIVISKAYPTNAKKSRELLRLYGLDEIFNSIIFCERNEHKFPIAKAMHVDVMIDDKQSVLDTFDKTIHTILFTGEDASGLLYKIKAGLAE